MTDDEDLGNYAPVIADNSARRSEIEHVMRTDIGAYHRSGMDRELTELVRQEKGELQACEPMPATQSRALMQETPAGRQLVSEWNAMGGFEPTLQRVQGEVTGLVQGMGDDRAQRAFMARFDREIPEETRYKLYSVIALGPYNFVTPATEQQIEKFREGGPIGDELIAEWGARTPEKIGQIQTRMGRLREVLGEDGMQDFLGWFNAISDAQVRRVLQFIAK